MTKSLITESLQILILKDYSE